jgi:5-methylcytosine-specific restriction endonuclease McrA
LLASADHCALCGQVIDKTLKTPHPLSPEIDEIIPISLGGSPIELSNLQLTHRICNQKKSNKVLSRTTVRSPIRLSRIW